MRLLRVKSGLVLLSGWVVILVSATVMLPSIESSAIVFPMLALMLIWFLLSVVALVFYFHRAWLRVEAVPNKAAYIAWLGIETAFALAAVAGLVWFFVTPS